MEDRLVAPIAAGPQRVDADGQRAVVHPREERAASERVGGGRPRGRCHVRSLHLRTTRVDAPNARGAPAAAQCVTASGMRGVQGCGSECARPVFERPTGGIGAPGFSGLRARFVLCDESGPHRRSLAPLGSGRAVPEHDRGQPGPACATSAAGDPLQHEPCAYLGRTGAEGDRGDNVTGRVSGRIRWPSTCATAPGDMRGAR